MAQLKFLLVTLFFLHHSVSAQEILLDKIAIAIGSVVITQNEIKQIIQNDIQVLRQQNQEVEPETLRKQVIKRVVENALLVSEAKKQKITVGDNELNQHIENFKKNQNLSDVDFTKVLLQYNLTLDNFKNQRKDDILRQKLIARAVRAQVTVRDADYRKGFDQLQSKKIYKVKHLLRQIPPNAKESDIARVKKQIKAIEEQVVDDKSFDQAIQDYSQDTTSKNNAGILEFEIDDVIVAFQKQVRVLKTNQRSEIFLTNFGYHIIQLIDIEEKKNNIKYEEYKKTAHDTIFNAKFNEQLDEFFGQLKSRHQIKVFDENLKKYIQNA